MSSTHYAGSKHTASISTCVSGVSVCTITTLLQILSLPFSGLVMGLDSWTKLAWPPSLLALRAMFRAWNMFSRRWVLGRREERVSIFYPYSLPILSPQISMDAVVTPKERGPALWLRFLITILLMLCYSRQQYMFFSSSGCLNLSHVTLWFLSHFTLPLLVAHTLQSSLFKENSILGTGFLLPDTASWCLYCYFGK